MSEAKGRVLIDAASLSGPERAAVLLLALGPDHEQLWSLLDMEEVKEITQCMVELGRIPAGIVQQLMERFCEELNSIGGIKGSLEQTQRLLAAIMSPDKVDAIIQEIHGPTGRTMWDKLANVHEGVLANYLKDEYPQTAAVVLSKIKPEHASKVLACMPEDFALECVSRMLRMEPVHKDILSTIEETLRIEFMANLSKATRRDSHESMADIFNAFDRQTETRFMTALETSNRVSAERIRALMFVFEDLAQLDPGGVQTLLRVAPKEKLALALKRASEQIRSLFMSNMSERAAKILREEIDGMGPVRLRDVDLAQAELVALAKDLAAKGEIILAEQGEDNELVY